MQPNGQWQGNQTDNGLDRTTTPTVILPMSEAAPTSFENALNNIPQLPEEKAALSAAQTVVQQGIPRQPETTQLAATPPPVADTSPQHESASPQESPIITTSTTQSLQEIQPVYWEGLEYIQRDKDHRWFAIFGVIVAVFLGLGVWQAVNDLFSGIIIILLILSIAAAIIVMAKKPPRVIKYTLGNEGLYVNDELHRLTDFKSFGVMTEGGEYSIFLMPVKRFSLGVTLYFPRESGEAIVDMLGARLPMQPLKLDLLEKFIRKIRL